jgi:hypothetical protein
VLACLACATASPTPAPAQGSAATAASQPSEDAEAARKAFIRRVELKYPSDEYIVGYGYAETPDQAEERARVDAASAISSQIDANLRALQSESGVGSQHTMEVSVSDEIVRKVTTDAGAFIQPVHDLTTQVGNSFQAVAIADRNQLDQKYATDASRLLERIELAWDRALAGADSSDQSVVLTALCDSKPDEQALDKIDRERQLVTRHTTWTPEAVAKRHRIEEVRSHLKGARVIVYQPAVEGLEVSDALVKRLGAAGYDVGLTTDPKCTKADLLINVALDETCGSSMLGQKCEANLTATSQRCASGETLFDERSDKVTRLNATDVGVAQRAVLRALDTKKFVDAVAGRVLVALEGGCHR